MVTNCWKLENDSGEFVLRKVMKEKEQNEGEGGDTALPPPFPVPLGQHPAGKGLPSGAGGRLGRGGGERSVCSLGREGKEYLDPNRS